MLQKNDELICEITGYTGEGNGVARYGSFPIFVPGTIINETVKIKVLKVLKNYGFGKVLEVITSSPERVTPLCPLSLRCGGCNLMHMSYAEQLNFKKIKVTDTMRKIGGFRNITVNDTVPSPLETCYRNKVSVPVSESNGEIIWGFYAVHSHNIISCSKCFLHDDINNKIINCVTSYMKKFSISPYDENTNKGTVKHIYIRRMNTSGEIMVSVVSAKRNLPEEQALVGELIKITENIKSIIINYNPLKTNIILGSENKVLFGNDHIYDVLLDTKFKIHHNSFYQVNSSTTKLLYTKAINLLGDVSDKVILDLYCGIGTISLITAQKAKKVYGIEYVQDAIDDAVFNAKLNEIENAEFYAGDASEEIVKIKNKGIKPDYVIVDPPRKGCDKKVLETINELSPEKIVYVSCDPATLARDMKILQEFGYTATEVTPFDMFPQTNHVECCMLLCRGKIEISVV